MLTLGARQRSPLGSPRAAPGSRYNSLMRAEAVTRLTYEQFRQLPEDGKRYELIRGQVHLTPAPSTRHQFVQLNLSNSLFNYLAEKPVGELLTAPLDVRLSDDIAVQPDIIFVSNARTRIIQENFVGGAPDLVIEILSPSTVAHDRTTKLTLYAEAGVPEVWLIDPQARTVEVLKLEGKKYFLDSTLAGDQSLTCNQFPDWELPLNELFNFRSRF